MVSSLERAQNQCSGNPLKCLSSLGTVYLGPESSSHSQGGLVQTDTDYVTLLA